MISSVRPLYAGNALQVSLKPPTGALKWRLLRKAVNTFTGEDDAQAYIAFEGDDQVITDAAPGLTNEVPAYYKPYYFDGNAWTTAASVAGTPLATYQDASTDALEMVRDRLMAGLAVEIERETFKLEGAQTVIQVLTAPPAAAAVDLPVVTVHLTREDPGDRGVGEMITGDIVDPADDQWVEHEGWNADVELEIVGWSLNPDERIEMRKALRRILIANLGIFASAGMNEVAFSASDIDAISGEYVVPVYQVMVRFTCKAPVIVTNKVAPITDIIVEVSGEFAPVN